MDDDNDNEDNGGGAEDDLLASLMSRSATITSKNDLISTFASVCSIDDTLAQFFIDSAGGNLQVAINLFYEYGASTASIGGGRGRGGDRGGGSGSSGVGTSRAFSSLEGDGSMFMDAVQASQFGVAPQSTSFIPPILSSGGDPFSNFHQQLASISRQQGQGLVDDSEDYEDKALQMAIALSSGIAVSDADQIRAMEAQSQVLLRSEQSRISDPFAAYGSGSSSAPVATTSNGSSTSSSSLQGGKSGTTGGSGDMEDS